MQSRAVQSNINDAIKNIVKGHLGSRLGDCLTSELSDSMASLISESIVQHMDNIAQKDEPLLT